MKKWKQNTRKSFLPNWEKAENERHEQRSRWANKGVTLLRRDGAQLDELAYHLHGFGTHHLLHRHHLGLHERGAKDDACVCEASQSGRGEYGEWVRVDCVGER
jgi:hypothetical protein